MVVLGPGSLFTSILPNLMIDEIGKAILETKAQIAYVCNIMTQEEKPSISQTVTTLSFSINIWEKVHRYCPCQYQSGSAAYMNSTNLMNTWQVEQ